MRGIPRTNPRTDGELVACLAEGQPGALTPLYARYRSLVFHIASQSLDTLAAEDIVQENFLGVKPAPMIPGAAPSDPGCSR